MTACHPLILTNIIDVTASINLFMGKCSTFSFNQSHLLFDFMQWHFITTIV